MKTSQRGEIVTILTIGTFLVLGLATILSTTVLKTKTPTQNTKASGINCSQYPFIPPNLGQTPSGYYWEADCNKYCTRNDMCPQSTDPKVYPGTSNWCFGFGDGSQARCMMLKAGTPGSGGNQAIPATCNNAVQEVYMEKVTKTCIVKTDGETSAIGCYVRNPGETVGKGCEYVATTTYNGGTYVLFTCSKIAGYNENMQVAGLRYQACSSNGNTDGIDWAKASYWSPISSAPALSVALPGLNLTPQQATPTTGPTQPAVSTPTKPPTAVPTTSGSNNTGNTPTIPPSTTVSCGSFTTCGGCIGDAFNKGLDCLWARNEPIPGSRTTPIASDRGGVCISKPTGDICSKTTISKYFYNSTCQTKSGDTLTCRGGSTNTIVPTSVPASTSTSNPTTNTSCSSVPVSGNDYRACVQNDGCGVLEKVGESKTCVEGATTHPNVCPSEGDYTWHWYNSDKTTDPKVCGPTGSATNPGPSSTEVAPKCLYKQTVAGVDIPVNGDILYTACRPACGADEIVINQYGTTSGGIVSTTLLPCHNGGICCAKKTSDAAKYGDGSLPAAPTATPVVGGNTGGQQPADTATPVPQKKDRGVVNAKITIKGGTTPWQRNLDYLDLISQDDLLNALSIRLYKVNGCENDLSNCRIATKTQTHLSFIQANKGLLNLNIKIDDLDRTTDNNTILSKYRLQVKFGNQLLLDEPADFTNDVNDIEKNISKVGNLNLQDYLSYYEFQLVPQSGYTYSQALMTLYQLGGLFQKYNTYIIKNNQQSKYQGTNIPLNIISTSNTNFALLFLLTRPERISLNFDYMCQKNGGYAVETRTFIQDIRVNVAQLSVPPIALNCNDPK